MTLATIPSAPPSASRIESCAWSSTSASDLTWPMRNTPAVSRRRMLPVAVASSFPVVPDSATSRMLPLVPMVPPVALSVMFLARIFSAACASPS